MHLDSRSVPSLRRLSKNGNISFNFVLQKINHDTVDGKDRNNEHACSQKCKNSPPKQNKNKNKLEGTHESAYTSAENCRVLFLAVYMNRNSK